MICSFKVLSSHEVDVPEHFLTIGKGLDTFTVSTDDPDALVQRLADEGVKVLECNQLDNHERVEPSPDLLAAAYNMQQLATYQLASGLESALDDRPLEGGADGQGVFGGEKN